MRRLHNVFMMGSLFLLIVTSACGRAPTPPAPTQAPMVTQAPVQVPAAQGEPIPVSGIDYEQDLEELDPGNFSSPTTIDNQWFPYEVGTQFVYEGVTEDAGLSIPHRVVITITDLTKEIAGVRTVVTWDQDFSDGELVETELAFFAQDDDGNVWRLGEYPEAYEDGKLVDVPAWIAGFKGARAGMIMEADPKPDTPSYSQGWGPAVNFTDRGQVSEVGQKTCVPLDCYENVLVIKEFSREEPDAFQLKYYAPGVGNVRVGWQGADATQETLELIEIIQLDGQALEEVRAQALELEQRAYQISKEVYDQTPPAR